jgi:hypothetical protein
MQLTYMNARCVDGRTYNSNDFILQNDVDPEQTLQCSKSLSYPVQHTQ